jgi:hypothetical protein
MCAQVARRGCAMSADVKIAVLEHRVEVQENRLEELEKDFGEHRDAYNKLINRGLGAGSVLATLGVGAGYILSILLKKMGLT